MRLASFAAALVACTVLPAQAFAGGVGIVATGGMRNDPVYFYDNTDCDASGDCAQYKAQQLRPNVGGGLEFVLGDRDERISGVFRGYWTMEPPQVNPADNEPTDVDGNVLAPEDVTSNVRDTNRHIGLASFGAQWGLVGEPDKFQLTLITTAGAGFLTSDHTEFLFVQAGPGFTYRTSRSTQLFVDLEYMMRFRKGFTHGANAYVGMRYLFD